MKVEDRSLVTSSGKIVGVLKRRAHPPELSHKSRWQNDPKSLVPERSDWPVTEVISSNLMDLEDEEFKATEKMSMSPTIEKTRDNADHGDLENNLMEFGLIQLFGDIDDRVIGPMMIVPDHNKLVRVLVIFKKTTIARGLFGGTSVVGRSKVGKEINAPDNNDIWLVLFHLEQSIMLKEEPLMNFDPIGIERTCTTTSTRLFLAGERIWINR
jgi:hypothetical protein